MHISNKLVTEQLMCVAFCKFCVVCVVQWSMITLISRFPNCVLAAWMGADLSFLFPFDGVPRVLDCTNSRWAGRAEHVEHLCTIKMKVLDREAHECDIWTHTYVYVQCILQLVYGPARLVEYLWIVYMCANKCVWRGHRCFCVQPFSMASTISEQCALNKRIQHKDM